MPLDIIDSCFKKMVNGEWEHHHGITIETTDNPGWIFKIDLHPELTKKSIMMYDLLKKSADIEGTIKDNCLFLYSNNLSLLVERASFIIATCMDSKKEL
jgi:Immunity protein 53